MRVDILATLRTADVVPVAIEYDGQYYHSSPLSQQNDFEKTMRLLEKGFYVVRIREAMGSRQLPLLPIQSPRLLQLEHAYSRSPLAVAWIVGEIDGWLRSTRIYPVNDGTNPRYPQETPKQRILAYLRALAAGDELTTEQSMEECYQLHLAAEAAEAAGHAQ